MTHVPMEHWILGSSVLTIATVKALDLLPVPELPGYSLWLIWVFWMAAWAYSPLPQGPQDSNTLRRKRVWGFEVETEDGPQKELSEFGDNSTPWSKTE